MQDAQSNARLTAPGLFTLMVLFLLSGFSLPAAGDVTLLPCEPSSCLIAGETTGDGSPEGGLPRNEPAGQSGPNFGRCQSAIPATPHLSHCVSFPVLPQAPPLA